MVEGVSVRGALPAFAVLTSALGVLAQTPAPDAAPRADRIYARGQAAWIYQNAKKEKHALGYIRMGTSLTLRNEEPKKGPGCADYYYPVEPYGWVCLDRSTTLSGEGRWISAMKLAAPGGSLMPFSYALSNGAPMYRRLPTEAEVKRETAMFGKAGSFKAQSWGNRGHEKLAETRNIAGKDALPWFLEDGGDAGSDKRRADPMRRQIPHGSMLAYTKAFEYEGRTYLFSADGTVVPADRVRPFRVSSFHGVPLGKGAALPLAFFREKARPKYRRDEDGSFSAASGSWPVRSYVALDDSEPVESGKQSYVATRERDGKGATLYAREDDATVIRARSEVPIGVKAGSKWILLSITEGTLVAYDGLTPVYATLQSPGAGGVPVKGKDPVKMSTTPMGVYRVTFKHVAATMSPEYGENRKFWIADVPYTQYFNAPFALHTAYWHESFGEPMSAGCVNLSPRDGKWLFDWTTPHVPEGWGGAGPGGANGEGTYVVVSR
jgi:L,D-transpeptidase catalytic domain